MALKVVPAPWEDDHGPTLDTVLVTSFVVLVPLTFLVRHVQSVELDGDGDGDGDGDSVPDSPGLLLTTSDPQSGKQRVWHFVSSTADDRDMWVASLLAAKEHNKDRKAVPPPLSLLSAGKPKKKEKHPGREAPPPLASSLAAGLAEDTGGNPVEQRARTAPPPLDSLVATLSAAKKMRKGSKALPRQSARETDKSDPIGATASPPRSATPPRSSEVPEP
eukprot:COSAG04_NODE_1101_length_8253_cov_2.646309_4_plen_219_part_00